MSIQPSGMDIEFTPEAVKQYLDDCISHWRGQRWESDELEDIRRAEHYIDAYQSVRVSLFGTSKP